MLFTLNQTALSSTAQNAIVDAEISKHLQLRYDGQAGILWNFIKTNAPSHFSHGLLDSIRGLQNAIEARADFFESDASSETLKYLVFGSENPRVFSLGGDLQLFKNLILDRDRAGLMKYAVKATDAVYHHAVNSRGILTFSLVRGTAMGGGFEAALAANVLVAERGTRLGFPEVLFGLFPGMGAYTFLKRRVDVRLAKSIIESAKNYSAEELHSLGIVDVLAEPGQGEKAIYEYIARRASRPGIAAFHQAVRMVDKINLDELYSIAELWVDTALKLSHHNVRRIDRLVSSQKKNYGIVDSVTEDHPIRATRLTAIA